MLNQTPGSKDEGAWARQRELQHAVLLYLTVHGPTNWDQLHLHFNTGTTGEIGTALYHLAQWLHITVEDNLVNVSPSGTARLSAGCQRP
jgi:hypothetical protein